MKTEIGVRHDVRVPPPGPSNIKFGRASGLSLLLAKLVRFSLAHHHDHRPTRRDPFIFELQGDEVGQLACPG
jgi:hypothetical protein